METHLLGRSWRKPAQRHGTSWRAGNRWQSHEMWRRPMACGRSSYGRRAAVCGQASSARTVPSLRPVPGTLPPVGWGHLSPGRQRQPWRRSSLPSGGTRWWEARKRPLAAVARQHRRQGTSPGQQTGAPLQGASFPPLFLPWSGGCACGHRQPTAGPSARP